jgi:hypothetical protein
VDFLKENYDNLEAKEIGLRNGVIHELTEWIQEYERKIHIFD